MDCPILQRFSLPLCSLLLLGERGYGGRGFTCCPSDVPHRHRLVGGFVAHDNPIHHEVQLATRLGKESSATLQVRVFENHRGEQAREEVLRLLDTNKDGALSAEEKSGARIAIYGHSWGASEAVALARALEREQIPVLLTVQVDSVQKAGEDDASIPANVLRSGRQLLINRRVARRAAANSRG